MEKSQITGEAGDDQQLEIVISNPHKIRDGMSSYVVYQVTTQTNLLWFRKRNFSVSRRFSDFLGLHDKLIKRHLHLGRIVPHPPEKSVVGMTKVRMSKDEIVSSDDFIEKRRAALERYVNRIASNSVLRMDTDFRDFLQIESDLPKATNTSALSGANMVQLFNKISDKVDKLTQKVYESDLWFDVKQSQINSVDQKLRKIYSCVEMLEDYHKQLSLSTSELSQSAAMLGNCEKNTELSETLLMFAATEENIGQLENKQANHDFCLLSELVREYISLTVAVKAIFDQRFKAYQSKEHAQQILAKKKEQKAKLELNGGKELSQATEDVREWEAKVEREREKYEDISKMIHNEVQRFEMTRVQDFKKAMVKYMKSLLEAQRKVAQYWESFLQGAKALDANF